MKNIRIFYLKNCHFLVVKFSVYLNRRVFVMRGHIAMYTEPLKKFNISELQSKIRLIHFFFYCNIDYQYVLVHNFLHVYFKQFKYVLSY